MPESSIKVTYSVKNVLLLIGISIWLLATSAFLIHALPYALVNDTIAIVPGVFSIYLIYLIFDRIKEISFVDGDVVIHRFLLSSLSFRGENIESVSKDVLKIGNKAFNLRFVRNKTELITLILRAMEISDSEMERYLNGILNREVTLHNSIESVHKNLKTAKTSLIISSVFVGVIVIASIVSKHLSILYIFCLVLFVVLALLMDYRFKKAISKIKSTFLQLFLNGLI